MAFVISLAKPIRQGNQKYQHLIIETHQMDTTMTLNIPEDNDYGGNLTSEMTAPMSTLFAKIFKILTQTTVYVPKHFLTSQGKCAIDY